MNNLDGSCDPVENKVGFNSLKICCYSNAIIVILLACYFFLIPFCLMMYYLADPVIKGEGMSRFAIRLHSSLTPKYEKWARKRVDSKQAVEMSIEDIAGTEWPVFGSAFYLWSSQSLQQAWDNDNSITSVAPKIYAAGAIKAATDLVADPGHASWVKLHWGEDYLHGENVFFRMLLISSLTNYQKLLGDNKYEFLLRDQALSLAQELDESPFGLLDDYPGECYPSDVIAAIASIRRADNVLGTDHSDFAGRSVRAFRGRLVDSTGLPPYFANASLGTIGIARGCSSQWVTLWAPELWPEYAKELYNNFEEHFWQEGFAAGFREFPKDMPENDWYFDVDSGPVLAGFGAAASAFGAGAARANGRFDHAYPLTAEAIVFSWPLPDGTLLGPRILSNTTHAPYLGETAILFALTRQPAEGVEIVRGGHLPAFAYLFLALYLTVGILLLFEAIVVLKRRNRQLSQNLIPFRKIQIFLWLGLIIASFVLFWRNSFLTGIVLIFSAQLLPQKLSMFTVKYPTD